MGKELHFIREAVHRGARFVQHHFISGAETVNVGINIFASVLKDFLAIGFGIAQFIHTELPGVFIHLLHKGHFTGEGADIDGTVRIGFRFISHIAVMIVADEGAVRLDFEIRAPGAGAAAETPGHPVKLRKECIVSFREGRTHDQDSGQQNTQEPHENRFSVVIDEHLTHSSFNLKHVHQYNEAILNFCPGRAEVLSGTGGTLCFGRAGIIVVFGFCVHQGIEAGFTRSLCVLKGRSPGGVSPCLA